MRSLSLVSLAIVALLAASCGDDDAASTGPTGATQGAGSGGTGAAGGQTGASSTSTVSSGGGPGSGGQGGAGGQGGTGGEGGCAGSCATLDVTATFGAVMRPFDHAYYGVEPAGGNGFQLHVELYRGGVAGCPSMGSPTPDHTVVITGLPAPLGSATQTEADGLAVSLLDFEGSLLGGAPIASANTETVVPVSDEVCTSCFGQGDDPNGYVAFDLNAVFDSGLLSGHVYATHCASLDAP